MFALQDTRPWVAHERHYDLDLVEDRNYEVPVGFVSPDMVVVGSPLGVVNLLNIVTGELLPLTHSTLSYSSSHNSLTNVRTIYR